MDCNFFGGGCLLTGKILPTTWLFLISLLFISFLFISLQQRVRILCIVYEEKAFGWFTYLKIEMWTNQCLDRVIC
jgi:hypothetical protein